VSSIKEINPDVKGIVVFSGYNHDRFPVEEAEEITNFIDLVLINEEIEHLTEAIQAFLRNS